MNDSLKQRLHALIIRQEVIQEEQREINKELKQWLTDEYYEYLNEVNELQQEY